MPHITALKALVRKEGLGKLAVGQDWRNITILNGLFIAIIALHSPFKCDIVVLAKWAISLINRGI